MLRQLAIAGRKATPKLVSCSQRLVCDGIELAVDRSGVASTTTDDFMAQRAQRSVAACKKCGKRNRLVESGNVGMFRCGDCGGQLSPPFRYVVFDCETTGLRASRAPTFLVQLAWSVHEHDGTLVAECNYVVKPSGYKIPEASTRIHGITHAHAMEVGAPVKRVLESFFATAVAEGVRLVAHNISFDVPVVDAAGERAGLGSPLRRCPYYCTMRSTTEICQIPQVRGGGFKWPTLQELHLTLFGRRYAGGHDAMQDVRATARCFSELRRKRYVTFQ